MIINDAQKTIPSVLFTDLYANINALSVLSGSIAYATDTDQIMKRGASAWGAVGAAAGGDVIYHQEYDTGEQMSDYVSYVDIPTGASVIKWMLTGTIDSASRPDILVQLGYTSIDTGANYVYYVRDTYSSSSDDAATYMQTIRSCWGNASTEYAILTAVLFGLGAGETHSMHVIGSSDNDRNLGWGVGNWISSDPVTKILTFPSGSETFYAGTTETIVAY